jgi:hypothetical protein
MKQQTCGQQQKGYQKGIILDGYLGIFFNSKSTNENYFYWEKNSNFNADDNHPKSIVNLLEKTSESKRAGL